MTKMQYNIHITMYSDVYKYHIKPLCLYYFRMSRLPYIKTCVCDYLTSERCDSFLQHCFRTCFLDLEKDSSPESYSMITRYYETLL